MLFSLPLHRCEPLCTAVEHCTLQTIGQYFFPSALTHMLYETEWHVLGCSQHCRWEKFISREDIKSLISVQLHLLSVFFKDMFGSFNVDFVEAFER